MQLVLLPTDIDSHSLRLLLFQILPDLSELLGSLVDATVWSLVWANNHTSYHFRLALDLPQIEVLPTRADGSYSSINPSLGENF